MRIAGTDSRLTLAPTGILPMTWRSRSTESGFVSNRMPEPTHEIQTLDVRCPQRIKGDSLNRLR